METKSYDAGEDGTMVFSRQCPKCNRFVKTPRTCDVSYDVERDCPIIKCIATCSRCGKVKLNFIGYF